MTTVNADMLAGRKTVLTLTNKSGGGVVLGDVVIVDASNDEAFTTTTTSGLITSAVGVVQETIANNASGRVLVEGYTSLILTSASVTRGQFGKTHTVAKQAVASASRVAGVFCQFLTGGTTPTAMLFGMSDGSTGSAGSAGTPAVTLSTTNATGSAVTLIATDATIAVFDATVPAALGTAATGSAGTAARRDHVHPLTFPTFGNAAVATSQGLTGNNSFADLATTGPAVTITTNTKVLVILTAHCSNTTNGGYGGMGFAVSGATTVAATATKCLQFGSGAVTFDDRTSATYYVSGLTPGSNVFTAKYHQFNGPGTTNWSDREMTVILLD